MLSLLFIEGVEELFQLALVAFGEGVVFLEHGSGVFVERNGTAVDRNVGASGDVVQTDPVEVRQLDGTRKRKFTFSFFIFAIVLGSCPKICCKFRLCFVCIFPQISEFADKKPCVPLLFRLFYHKWLKDIDISIQIDYNMNRIVRYDYKTQRSWYQ